MKKSLILFIIIILIVIIAIAIILWLPGAGWKNVKLSNFAGYGISEAGYSDIAWNGSGYGFVWTTKIGASTGKLFFAPLDFSGNKQSNDIELATTNKNTNWGNPGVVRIVRSGNEYGVLYGINEGNGNVLKFIRLSLSGDKLTEIYASVPNDNAGMMGADSFSLVWTGTEYAAVWSGRQYVYFIRIDTSGNLIKKVAVVSSQNIYNPDITWDGENYGLVWAEWGDSFRDIYFIRVNPDGTGLTSKIKITNNVSASYPQIAWQDNYYSLIFREGNYIYYTKVDFFGTKLMENKKISNKTATDIRLAKAQNIYGIAWSGESGQLLYFKKIDNNGNSITNDKVINSVGGVASQPHLIWTGTKYGIIWLNAINNVGQIYFATGN